MSAVANSTEAWDRRARRASTDWEAAMWSEHGQTSRFVALLAHLGLRAGDNILDFGCGTGRLVEFVPRSVSYVGVDSSGEMLMRAKEERRRGTFFQGVPPWKFDHVVAVGTFNLADRWTKKSTWEVLDNLWEEHARRTLAVSLYRGEQPDSLVYDADEVVQYASSRTVEFLIDASYLDNDLLLVMRKSGVR